MSGLRKYIAKCKGHVSDLSKQESKALMNLLGVGPTGAESGAVGAAAQLANVEDDDEAAKQLLSMIKKNPAESHEETSDRNVLLDLLKKTEHTAEGEQSQVESAKEILGLLRSHIDENQPAASISGGFAPMPMPPPNMWIPGSMPPNMFPPQPFPGAGFMHPPPPPAPPGQPGGPPIPPPLTQSQAAIPVPPSSITSTGEYRGISQQQPVDYASLAPPAPPNAILQSLLASRQSKKTKSSSATPQSQPQSEHQRDPRFESSHISANKSLKLTDLLGDDKRGSGGLLSLLGDNSPKPAVPEEPRSSASGADLLSLIKGGEPARYDRDITPTPSSSGQALMDMLNPSRQTEEPAFQGNRQPSDNASGQTGGQTGGQALMNMLNPSGHETPVQPTQDAPVATSSSSQALMDMLNPGASRKQQSLAPSQTTSSGQALMDMLNPGPPSRKEPSPAPASAGSSGRALMDMLSPEPGQKEGSPAPTSATSSSQALMDMLNPNANRKEPSPAPAPAPVSKSSRALMDMLSPGAGPEPSSEPTPAAPSSGQALMDMLNPTSQRQAQSPPVHDSHRDGHEAAQRLMGMLDSGATNRPAVEHARPDSAASGGQFMDMLNSQPVSRESTVSPIGGPSTRKTSTAGRQLLDMLGEPSKASPETHWTQQQRQMSRGSQLMGMLGQPDDDAAASAATPRSPSSSSQNLLDMLHDTKSQQQVAQQQQERQHQHQQQSASSRQLMDLLGSGSGSGAGPGGSSSMETSQELPSNGSRNLLGLLNTAATPSAASTRTVPRGTDSFLNRQSSPGDSMLSVMSDNASVDSQPQPLLGPAIKAQPPLQPIGSPTTSTAASPAPSKAEKQMGILSNDFAASHKAMRSPILEEESTDDLLLAFLKTFAGSR